MVEIVWVGIDIGRHAHHAAAVDDSGAVLWSRRIRNDQAEVETLLERIADVGSVVWAIDMTAPESALLRGVLAAHGQQVRYAPGRVVHNMTGAFAGEGKTDARDAVAIAQTARLRGNLARVSNARRCRHRARAIDRSPKRARSRTHPRHQTTACPADPDFPWTGAVFRLFDADRSGVRHQVSHPVVDQRGHRRRNLRSPAYSRGSPTHDP